jgi:thiamine biosynthesis lipoprotein
VWRRPDGSYAHHLLDPANGAPAWTGLVSATAVAPTALEAEALAKAALLAGPRGAPRFLAAAGGIVVRDDGRAEVIGGGKIAGGRGKVVVEGGGKVAVAGGRSQVAA